MYRNLTYLLENGAFPWADQSLTCQLKNRQVGSLTGLIVQIPCNSHHRELTEEEPGFKVVHNLHWVMVGGLHFLNRRWLLVGHLCNFSVLPDIPSLLPTIYVSFYLSKWQSFWVRDYNFLHMYTHSSDPTLRAPCTLKVYVIDLSRVWEDCRETTEGFGVSMWMCRRYQGSWECCHSWNWASSPGKMIPSCKSHLGLASLSAALLLPAADRAKHSCLHSYRHHAVLLLFLFLTRAGTWKFCPQLPSSQSFLFAL